MSPGEGKGGDTEGVRRFWRRLGLGDEWLRAVCHDNGARLFGLPGT
ncbi:hypothetical protein [Streptomyces poonensis]|uniref:Uncharacterized protein n=1 Tax=Streptomyces poonensis TaxID=68255 RepID=A0A918PV62_9ACTN|nr:hypothetical protein [Streptomyces poonensis]GGZ24404.1 hypothetical protein GCM10010365_50870 [Streptomyces poonensis]GLJ89973.1 hypothetical protein GCM10017589_25740 [Streptomyces poonensis]